MRFWKGLPGGLLLIALLAALVGSGVTLARVRRVTHPARAPESPLDLSAMLARVEEVRFRSADGLELAGWLVPGRPDGRAIVLCHDFGGSKASVINLANPLHRDGFTVLAFDFRGHGGSEGVGSTLGLAEKRDVIGAVDYLAAREGLDRSRVGIYGVGMGAFAAVLAARDRPTLRVLVLDGLYPDVEYPLVRRAFENWRIGVEHFAFLPRAIFGWSNRGVDLHDRASATLPELEKRELLFLAPATDLALTAEIERMYRSLPERRDVEGNLVTLSATAADGLYGEALGPYLVRVEEFFRTRLD